MRGTSFDEPGNIGRQRVGVGTMAVAIIAHQDTSLPLQAAPVRAGWPRQGSANRPAQCTVRTRGVQRLLVLTIADIDLGFALRWLIDTASRAEEETYQRWLAENGSF